MGGRNPDVVVSFPSIMSGIHSASHTRMSTVSNLTLRRALADPVLRESLLVSALVLVASVGLAFLASWGRVLHRARCRTAAPAFDWLVVCGHALQAGQPSSVYRQRLRRAARLAADDTDIGLLLAGGGRPSEAAVGRDWLVAEHDLEPARIHLEEISTDTFENLRHARGLLPTGARLGIVTSRFHMARVLAYARQLGLDAVPVPAEARWRLSAANIGAGLREAAFLYWFACGRAWARLARRERLLERIR